MKKRSHNNSNVISNFSRQDELELHRLLQQYRGSSLKKTRYKRRSIYPKNPYIKHQEKRLTQRLILVLFSINLSVLGWYLNEKMNLLKPLRLRKQHHIHHLQSLTLQPQLEKIKASQDAQFPLKAPSTFPVTSEFGFRIHPIHRQKKLHSGIDYGAPHGAPVLAADEGVVTFSGWRGGYGKTIIIEHDNGLTTLYAHNSTLLKRQGERVKTQEVIAKCGSSGLSTAPHIHFEVHQNGEPVNPKAYLLE